MLYLWIDFTKISFQFAKLSLQGFTVIGTAFNSNFHYKSIS